MPILLFVVKQEFNSFCVKEGPGRQFTGWILGGYVHTSLPWRIKDIWLWALLVVRPLMTAFISWGVLMLFSSFFWSSFTSGIFLENFLFCCRPSGPLCLRGTGLSSRWAKRRNWQTDAHKRGVESECNVWSSIRLFIIQRIIRSYKSQ